MDIAGVDLAANDLASGVGQVKASAEDLAVKRFQVGYEKFNDNKY